IFWFLVSVTIAQSSAYYLLRLFLLVRSRGAAFILSGIVFSKDVIRVIKLGAILALSAFVDSMVINGQRYIVAFDSGVEELGLYVSLMQFVLIAQVGVTAVGAYYIPRLSLMYEEDGLKFKSGALQCFSISLVIG